MILNSLKPAWQLLKFQRSLNTIDSEEVLRIIDTTEVVVYNKTQRILTNSAVFLTLMICCQGG